jgi:hypothetical protein
MKFEAEVFVMENAAAQEQACHDLRLDFYRRSLDLMNNSGIPFLVGGAYALNFYTGISRDTKDLDIFIQPEASESVLKLFAKAGFETSLTFTHWLAKATWGGHLVDIIFNSGNAISEVDDKWFEYARDGELFGIKAKFTPPEEMIWSKGFIMERERYDGADVNHILLACAKKLDWDRLLARFGPNWRILLSHLMLFGFVYPSERGLIPNRVMSVLSTRLEEENAGDLPKERICRGTLLSRSQYRKDLLEWGFKDARLIPNGKMTKKQIQKWDDGASVDGSHIRK